MPAAALLPSARRRLLPAASCSARIFVVVMATLVVARQSCVVEGFRGLQPAVVPARPLSFLHKASAARMSTEASDEAESNSSEAAASSKALGGGLVPARALAATATTWMATTALVMFPAASAWAAAASSSEGGGDEYVYGAVDAPVGLAVGAGILAIATAALPVLLRGGEEAFEEIRERDEGTFGSPDKNTDVLKSRRK